MTDLMAAAFDLVLFDLGGVLIELSGVTVMRELAGMDSDDELWERWLSCPWVRAFERGECTPEEFAVGMVEEWTLTVAPDVFLSAFRGWSTADTKADRFPDVWRRIMHQWS